MTTLPVPILPEGAPIVSGQQQADADEAVIVLYSAHYAGLVRLASLLVRHSAEAEEIVQDCFVAMHGRWGRLREPDKALAYLRRSVVNRARSVQRHHTVSDLHLHRQDPRQQQAPSAESHTLGTETRAAVMSALSTLSRRQREVLVLRYYSDLTERDIAETLGISQGAVKSHASRGLSALRSHLEDQR